MYFTYYIPKELFCGIFFWGSDELGKWYGNSINFIEFSYRYCKFWGLYWANISQLKGKNILSNVFLDQNVEEQKAELRTIGLTSSKLGWLDFVLHVNNWFLFGSHSKDEWLF